VTPGSNHWGASLGPPSSHCPPCQNEDGCRHLWPWRTGHPHSCYHWLV
jgi:hypothetical protein